MFPYFVLKLTLKCTVYIGANWRVWFVVGLRNAQYFFFFFTNFVRSLFLAEFIAVFNDSLVLAISAGNFIISLCTYTIFVCGSVIFFANIKLKYIIIYT